MVAKNYIRKKNIFQVIIFTNLFVFFVLSQTYASSRKMRHKENHMTEILVMRFIFLFLL